MHCSETREEGVTVDIQAKGGGGSCQQVAVGLERSKPVWDMNWRQSQQSLERMARYGGRETGESRMSLCPQSRRHLFLMPRKDVDVNQPKRSLCWSKTHGGFGGLWWSP